MESKEQVDEIRALLATLPEGESISDEELMFCSPYSDVEAWEWILMGQLLNGGARFKGPPGMLEKMEFLLEKASRRVVTDRYLEGLTVWGEPWSRQKQNSMDT